MLKDRASEIGSVIKDLRRQKGYSQEVISGLAGLARSHLSMIETGTKLLNLESLWRIAVALEIRPSRLVEEIEAALDKAK